MIHLEEPNNFFKFHVPVEAKQLMTEIYVLSECIIKTLLLLICFDQNRIIKIKLYNFRKIYPVNSLRKQVSINLFFPCVNKCVCMSVCTAFDLY